MKISMNWLDEWIEVADLDPVELAERLTMAGLEVDGIEERGAGFSDIVVGRIESIEEHDEADRLVVCRVDAGEGEKGLRTIVCGASNMSAGDRVPVALPGAAPPALDFGIEIREVMGVESQGMLCSAEELGLAESSQGLMILDEELRVGEPISDALGLRDVVLEIDLTPNRADCLSHLGVAREISALFGRPLRSERAALSGEFDEAGGAIDEVAALEVVDEQGCPQYRMAVVEDIRVGQSPQWLKNRLASVGLRSINSVVDVTNFVLMDVGQPLHAFDLDRLEGARVVVRRAEKGERFVGIDHEDYALDPRDLVIADAARPVALAGVMGGADTEVGEKTTRILLECAFFDPTTVRKSSKRHGLHTDSSHRFERGIDAGALEASIRRALDLLVRTQRESTGTTPTVRTGQIAEGESPGQGASIEVDPSRASRLLGVELSERDCMDYLKSIGLRVEQRDDVLSCRVPTFRRDLQRPVDLVEEIARLHGYDEIPAELPRIVAGAGHRKKRSEHLDTIVSRRERQGLGWLRSFLLSRGFLEAINYSFMGDADLERLRLEEKDPRRRALRVANPLVASQARMRTTLITSLLDNVKTNFAHRRRDVALFEIGRRYFEDRERRSLGLVATGVRDRHWSGTRKWDFFELKGVTEALARVWEIENTRWRTPNTEQPYLHPGVQAEWHCDGRLLGRIGQLHPAVAQSEGIEETLFFAEIDLDVLAESRGESAVAKAAPKYPAVIRDFALLYDEDRPYADLRDAIEELSAQNGDFASIFEGLELFDVYEGPQVPEGRRSLAIKVTYRSDTRTLEEEEIETADRQLLSHLGRELGAELR